MADQDVQFEDGAQLKKGKGLLFIIAGVVVVLGGAGAYWALSGDKGAEAAPSIRPDAVGPIMALPTFVVNLNEEQSNRYLKLSVSLELVREGAEDEVTLRIPMIRDSVISYLVSLSVADVRGAETKDAIRDTLLAKINDALNAALVRRVLFTEFVIQ